MSPDTEFCPHCYVSMSLHPEPGFTDEWACSVARRKANLLSTFMRGATNDWAR